MSRDGKSHRPANPHPLSQLRTEVIWEGKYDEYGNRREVDIAGCSLPMQKIETIDEPRSEAAAIGQLDIFEKQTKRLDDFRNMLIWGDNKLVMASLLKDFKGQINLIYIDPPFDVGADFTMNVPLGDEKDTVEKDQSTLEMVAYRDTWGKGTDSYLHMIFERLSLMNELLSDQGTIYVHLDWHVSHYVKAILDEVFGKDSFGNEVVWRRTNVHNSANAFGQIHDVMLRYTKSTRSTFNVVRTRYAKAYVEGRFTRSDERGFHDSGDLTGPGIRTGESGQEWMGFNPTKIGRHWQPPKSLYEQLGEDITHLSLMQRLDYLLKAGYVIPPAARGMAPRAKVYVGQGLPLQDVWAYQPHTSEALVDGSEIDGDVAWLPAGHPERLEYDTPKPDRLLSRIIRASSNKGDLIADFFCGSGTTGAVAERLGRRWLMADLGRFGIHTSRKRIIDLQRRLYAEGEPYRAFDVYNLGRYERQWWQKASLQGADEEHRRVVLEFFQAEILQNTPSPLIHGRKNGAFCHVATIDSMFSRQDASAVAKALTAASGHECYCLAWEFEMDLRLTIAALEQELGTKLKLIQIPREIMERNRKSPPPFLEMAVLEAESVYRSSKEARSVDIKLTKFIPSLAEVPTKELEALKERTVKSGFDFIDFWAVDFDWQPDKPFNHHWQDYRTRKDRSLKTVSEAGHQYAKPGRYMACVKVVDVFGCDTSITIGVKI